ncbi:stalk domain-containing protein [Paenibacillus sp. OV219]|uniref:stalk domain-containing protein n=1 Tax=Paenibacillus sp. OV219 TaxID=1884377 RepID=UPI0008D0F5DE|nr:DUF4163 domain-containing protein [Paenibacillus sp. OV219]SEN84913.1 Copper amine oxidase N-terminal domain-containing protein [Paenibacillus sp. OV219]
MFSNRFKHPLKQLTLGALGALGTLVIAVSAPLAFADEAAPTVTTTTGTVTAVPISAQLPASGAVKIQENKLTLKDEVFDYELHLPVISGMKDAKYQQALNANITARAMAVADGLHKQAKDDAAAAQGDYEFRPYSVYVSFELISDGSEAAGNILSFKVLTYTFTGGAHGATVTQTYNVRNSAAASQLKLKDLFGSNYKAIINKTVKAEISANPDYIFADSFKSISDNQAFYVKDNKVYFIFQQYEIAPYAVGMPEAAVNIPAPSNLASLPVVVNGTSAAAAKLYVNKEGVAMASLRPIAVQLGYTLGWNAKTQTVELTKGAQWTSLQVGKDRYTYARMAPFTLGTAPVVNAKTIYVPLTFFSQVLKAQVAYGQDSVTITEAAK